MALHLAASLDSEKRKINFAFQIRLESFRLALSGFPHQHAAS
jgi:hypothetical protein